MIRGNQINDNANGNANGNRNDKVLFLEKPMVALSYAISFRQAKE